MTAFESSDLVLQNSNFQALKKGKSTKLQGKVWVLVSTREWDKQ